MVVNERVVDAYPSRKKATAEMLKRKDPVVHGSLDSEGTLNRTQLQFYEERGFIVLDSLFTSEEIDTYRRELQQTWDESQTLEKPEIIKEPSSNEVRSVFAVHENNEVFKGLSMHTKLRSAVQQILGSQVYVHQSRINFKPGFNGKEFYWHSDFETWHVEDGMPRMRALSVSIALEDNYHYNGPLMLVPGSHKHYVTCVGETPDNHYEASLRKQEYGVPDHDSLTWLVEQGGIETYIGKKGSVLLFDCNTMHGSNGNITPFPRSNIFMVFNSVDNKLVQPFSGQEPRPDYIAVRS